MSLIIRAGTVDRTGDYAIRVGHWCDGITLVPEHLAGSHSLAATPIYLDRDDLIRLLVYVDGEFASEYLDEETVAHYLSSLAKTRHDDYVASRRDRHDEVMSHWDSQP